MLDGLADNLNDAVAQAVQGAVALAVEQAVRAVLNEALTNPAVRARLHVASQTALADTPLTQPANVAARPGMRERLSSCRNWVGARLKQVGGLCRAGWQGLRSASSACSRKVVQVGAAAVQKVKEKVVRARVRCYLLWRFKVQLAMALGVGLAIGLAGIYANPVVAAAANGVCGFVVTLAVQAGFWLRRLVLPAPLPSISASPCQG
jgi:hypothetical protein